MDVRTYRDAFLLLLFITYSHKLKLVASINQSDEMHRPGDLEHHISTEPKNTSSAHPTPNAGASCTKATKIARLRYATSGFQKSICNETL